MSRISSFARAANRRTNRVHSAHVRRISTVRLSTRRDDWVPEHPRSWKSRGLPSRYRIVLEVIVRPSPPIRSRVKTSPLACGSNYTVRLSGSLPSGVGILRKLASVNENLTIDGRSIESLGKKRDDSWSLKDLVWPQHSEAGHRTNTGHAAKARKVLNETRAALPE